SLKAEVLRLRRWRFGRSAEAIDPGVAPELPLGEGAVASVASESEVSQIPRLVSVDAPHSARPQSSCASRVTCRTAADRPSACAQELRLPGVWRRATPAWRRCVRAARLRSR